ncbi:hypothetical protein [Salinigranum sp.]|uniref:DUF7332 family protein n=1 Tax=Salinigranum sp. TaxID=1966351 RepID=UPI0035670E69
MVSGGSHSGSVRVVLLVALLVVSGTTGSAAATALRTDAPGVDRCFPPDGWEFVVGTEGPQIRLVLHLSLLPAVFGGESESDGSTNTSRADDTDTGTAAGAFGIEAVAATETAQIVSLQSGVLFAGVEDASAFLADPFAPFAFVFDYRLTIPAFEGTMADADYHTGDVPVEGPVEEAACSR